MFLWGTWVRVVEFGSSALHHHIWRESLLWLPGTNRYWTEWFFMTVDYDLICPGHNTSRVASSTQWCVPQVLGADTGPNALISQLLSCYLDPLFRLFWRRTLIIGPLSGTSKNTSGYCKRLNNITQFWALNWIWGSEPGGCKSVPTVWCHPLLWVRAATSHPLQVSVSLIFIEHTWSGQK